MVEYKFKHKINLITLVILSSSFVISIRNVPTMAETGMHMIFFGIVAAIGFFLPTALVAAELATGWPKEGGIYAWVREAFGARWGFLASWLQWANMLLSVTSMLYFIGGSLAFIFAPELAQNRFFLIAVLLIIVWISTGISFFGIKANARVSVTCFVLGVLLPGFLVIILGAYYLISGNPSNLDISFTANKILPDFRHIGTLVLILSFARTFTGIEASANHASKVDNPKRNYPLAILCVVILGLSINLLGAASVAVVIPAEKISLISGIMRAFQVFFTELGIQWIIPVLGLLVAAGSAGEVNAWLLGPVKGLLATAESGDLPPFFRKVNRHGIPSRLLILQGIIISIIGTFLLLSKSINIAFWTAVATSMTVYLTMYFLMMLSAIYLRYKRPEVERTYRIPGKKNIGMWIVSIIGMITLICLFFIALFPPSQLPTGSEGVYFGTILTGVLTVYITPFIIGLFKKPSWNVEKKDER